MPALFINKDVHLEDTLRNSLAPLWERDSIHFCNTYEAAEIFIQNIIVGEQQPLDMIICQNNVGGKSAVDFLNRITGDRARTFSNGHFYFHTVPVVLIVDEWENRDAFLPHGFAEVLHDIALDRLYLFSYELASVIKQWRRRLFGDLSNIGIPFERGRLLYTYTQSEKKREGIYTTVLSDAYKREPTKLLYDWVVNSERQMEVAIGKLEKELKRAARLDTHDERRISDLLEKYPVLVKRDNYSAHWHETRLPLGGRRSYRLDVTLKPNFNQLYDLSVLELKLPNEQFIVSPGFHPTLSSNVVRHISQVNDYKTYMGDAKYYQEVEQVFGFVPKKVEYKILMGRQEDKERHWEVFNRRLEEFNVVPKFVTYDEFVQTQIDYLERRDLLSIL